MRIVREYFQNATLHSLHFLAQSRLHWTEKLFWIVCIVVSWFGCLRIMINTYDQFQNKPISFTVDTNYLYFRTPFPSIVFCETDSAHIQKHSQRLSKLNDSYLLETIFRDFAFYNGMLSMTSFEQCAEIPEENCIVDNFTWHARAVRSSCPELFARCTWNKQQFPCCDYILPMETPLGPCYAINSIATNDVNLMDMDLSMKMKEGQLRVELKHKNVLVLAMSTEDIPRYSIQVNKLTPYDIADGTEYEIYLMVHDVKNDPTVRNVRPQRRGCRFPDENYLWTSKVYSYSACILQCQAEEQMKKCNCTHYLMPFADPKHSCDLQGMSCFNSHFTHLMSTSYCRCLPSCNQMEMDIVGVLMHDLSSDAEQAHHLSPDSTSVIKIKIPMATHQYIRKTVNSLLDVIVALGSVAALFLGASLLSIVEFFYFFLVRPATNACMEKRRRRKLWMKKPKGQPKVEVKKKVRFFSDDDDGTFGNTTKVFHYYDAHNSSNKKTKPFKSARLIYVEPYEFIN